VGQVGLHVAGAERGAEFLDLAPAVAEHEALLAVVQRGDHRGGVVQHADVVDSHLSGGRRRSGRGDDRCWSGLGVGPLQPAEQLVGVADGCRKANSLQAPAGQPGDPFQHGEQMPATVVASEGMHLIDDHHADTAEVRVRVDTGADQH
jgi:hypothetical protein